ncbi:RHS repeat-associated core domain-containing protein [Pirellulaceae bacterium SH467]
MTNFTYDIIDQLTAATTSAISGLSMPFSPTAESYNLDENGNRKSSGGASQSASGTHNRLQTDGTYNYTHDNEGNVTRRTKISDSTVTDYTWDYRNRLATVTDKVSASGATLKQVEYTYDAFDQRTAKRVDSDGNGTWDRYEVYTWADGQEVQRWVDTDGAGTGQKLRLANRYLWAESVDQLLSDEQYASGTGMEIDATTASGTAGTTLWALTDHLGSVRDLLDNNGVVREHNVFDSFGRLIREVDYNSSGTAISSTDAAAVDSIFGYTGRDWDSDIGMQYNRARWYDPQTGRWLSQDPIGFAAGDANLYRYVGNGPTNKTDPSGLQENEVPLPSDYPLDFEDKSVNETSALRNKLYWEGFSRASRNRVYEYGCGDLAAKRMGMLSPISDAYGRLPFPGSDGIHFFTSSMYAFEAADRMVKDGKRVRIFVFQTNRKPLPYDGLDEVHKGRSLPFEDLLEINPHSIQTGNFNFATLHWDGKKYYWEYVADGHTDKYRRVSCGNLPSYRQGYGYNYFGVVEITEEMERKATGLPKVPWEK